MALAAAADGHIVNVIAFPQLLIALAKDPRHAAIGPFRLAKGFAPVAINAIRQQVMIKGAFGVDGQARGCGGVGTNGLGRRIETVEQDVCIDAEMGADPEQHIRAWECRPRQIAVELRAVDPDGSAQGADRRRGLGQLAQIVSQNHPEVCRVG